MTISAAISRASEALKLIQAPSLTVDRIKSLKLNKQLAPENFSEVRVVYSGRDTKIALSKAISAGNSIVGTLNALKSSARLAGRGSLVSPLAKISIDGTRISRLNLSSDIQRAFSLINKLVSNSQFRNGNFISSSSPNIRIHTTRFGGKLDIAPQALDTNGLNLLGLSLLDSKSANKASVRIEAAANKAAQRINSLETLQRAINNLNFTPEALNSLTSELNGSGLPSGTLVNIIS
tara:strand:+ start:79 stop:783 length:705 start_codon:yes stop_codon:yes gene_type:complete